jgi:hypothetical protein
VCPLRLTSIRIELQVGKLVRQKVYPTKVPGGAVTDEKTFCLLHSNLMASNDYKVQESETAPGKLRGMNVIGPISKQRPVGSMFATECTTSSVAM